MPAIMEYNTETVASQLDQIELLRAMYPEIVVDHYTENLLEDLRQWNNSKSHSSPTLPTDISLPLPLAVWSAEQSCNISMNLSLPLGDGVDHPRLQVRQPDWLTKAEVAQLTGDMPKDDILSAIEHVKDKAAELFGLHQKRLASNATSSAEQPLNRAFFYFPSISTREKRDDLVRNAPSFKLTGFLLAGKPGVLCLEGGAQDIDDFMNYIKTVSWGDIPSQHKKVSERYRETGKDVSRVFQDMQEITDQIEKRGQRANRSDMKALESWLGERGLSESFAKVLM